MFKYVRWCSSVEEFAKGSCRQIISKIRRYSFTKLSNIFDFLDVKSKLFKTIHFLTVSPKILLGMTIFKPQFPRNLTSSGYGLLEVIR